MDSIDKINKILAQKGLSGAALERKIGVSNSVYSQWNTKTTKPSNKSLAKIASVLEVSIEEILPDKKEKPDLTDEIGPFKSQLLAAVMDLTEAEQSLLLEHIDQIKQLRR